MMRVLPIVLAAPLLAGCLGKISLPGGSASDYGSPNDPAAQACAAQPLDVPAVPLRRMSAAQYLNTERDLFAQQGLQLTLDTSGISSPVITQAEVQKINDAAEVVVATGGHRRFLSCNAAGAFDDGCAHKFITDFGLRAFRRPLDADELAWLTGVYQGSKTLADATPPLSFGEAIDLVATVMIQAPQHLYVSPVGVEDASLPSGILRLTGYERATQLSYLITNSTPDDALMQAAAQGSLDSDAGLREQAARLLDSDRGRAAQRSFASDYLGLNGGPVRPTLESLPKDSAKFPLDSPALRTAMRTEAEAFYEHVFYDLGGSFQKLMTSTDAYVDGALAKLYGVSGPTGTTFSWVKLDGTQRAGIFTRAAFLSEMANQEYESIIHRGVHLYKNVLCQPLGPPPANVNNSVPPVPGGGDGAGLTVRAQTDVRTAPAQCQGCHAQFNPIGDTLNNFDALGQWQTTNSGTSANGTAFTVPVDATATIPGTDIAGSRAGAIALSNALAQSQQAEACMGQHLFARSVGREVAKEDKCTMMKLNTSFKRSGGDMHAFVLDAATSPAMLYMRRQP